MRKRSLMVLLLLLAAVMLLSFGSVSAGSMSCADCKNAAKSYCDQPGMESNCFELTLESMCGDICGSSDPAKPQSSVVVIEPKPLPEDGIGSYYVGDDGVKKYVQFKTWADCMNYFNDASLCGRIVTDECESCMGACQAIAAKGGSVSQSCSAVCQNSCQYRNTGDSVMTGGGSMPGGEDDYGTWYLENGVRNYSTFKDFRVCWLIMGDAIECIRYGYSCAYDCGFYMYHLCSWGDIDCVKRITAEYDAACN